MSCTSNLKPYIKVGDSFDVPVQLINTEDGTGIAITQDMSFETKIVDVSGTVIAVPTVTPFPDQVANTGFILISVPTSVTSTWKVGKAKFDIKMSVDVAVKHSQTFSFDIKGAIT